MPKNIIIALQAVKPCWAWHVTSWAHQFTENVWIFRKLHSIKVWCEFFASSRQVFV